MPWPRDRLVWPVVAPRAPVRLGRAGENGPTAQTLLQAPLPIVGYKVEHAQPMAESVRLPVVRSQFQASGGPAEGSHPDSPLLISRKFAPPFPRSPELFGAPLIARRHPADYRVRERRVRGIRYDHGLVVAGLQQRNHVVPAVVADPALPPFAALVQAGIQSGLHDVSEPRPIQAVHPPVDRTLPADTGLQPHLVAAEHNGKC